MQAPFSRVSDLSRGELSTCPDLLLRDQVAASASRRHRDKRTKKDRKDKEEGKDLFCLQVVQGTYLKDGWSAEDKSC